MTAALPSAHTTPDAAGWALAYAAAGVAVLPLWPLTPSGECTCREGAGCTHPGKHPYSKPGFAPRGHLDATTEPTVVRRWWSACPEAGIGAALAPSGLIDIGPDSLVWRDTFRERGLPPTARFFSGGGPGHEHHLYRRPDDCPTLRVCKPEQYDILTDGILVLPPTRHARGLVRGWFGAAGGLPDLHDGIAAAPSWVVELLRAEAARRASGASPAAGDGAPEGEGPPVRLGDRAHKWWIGEKTIMTPDGAVDRSASLWAIAGELLRAGASVPATARALAERDVALDWRCYSDRRDAAGQYHAIAAKKWAEIQGAGGGAAVGADLDPDGAEPGPVGGVSPAPTVAPIWQMRRLSSVKRTPVRWLWPGRIPLGKLTILDGDPGLGKSLITADLTARVTRGWAMPDGTHGDLDGPATVILLSAEDDAADTIGPRADAAGADSDLIIEISLLPDERGREREISLADVEVFEGAILRTGAKLVIIDPIMAYVPSGGDAHRDSETRGFLRPLCEVAAIHGVALVGVRHLNKGASTNALYRGGGSIGWIGAARSGLIVAPDPDDTTGEKRVLAATKLNVGRMASSLGYTVVERDGQPVVAWGGPVGHSATGLVAEDATGEPRWAREEAVEFLRAELSDTFRTAKDLGRAARAAGISDMTLRRARRELGVKSRRVGGVGDAGYWVWELTAPSRARGGLEQVNALTPFAISESETDDPVNPFTAAGRPVGEQVTDAVDVHGQPAEEPAKGVSPDAASDSKNAKGVKAFKEFTPPARARATPRLTRCPTCDELLDGEVCWPCDYRACEVCRGPTAGALQLVCAGCNATGRGGTP